MITLSLCMIVRNEEAVLARCLDSVGAAADEIVIVDTGSTDRTREIARRYTDRVFDFIWIDDFAAARNDSFSHATGDYLMWLDADDVIAPADRQALIDLKATLDPGVDVVMMPYHAAFDPDGRPTLTYERERLLRRAAGFRWQGAVHEVIAPAGRVVRLPIAVCHRKIGPGEPDRNLRILEKQEREGRLTDPRLRFYYARELMAHGRYAEAADRLEQVWTAGEGWIEDRLTACRDLNACRRALGDPAAGREALCRAFSCAAPRAEVCCELGQSFFDEGRWREAIFWYDAARRCPREACGGFCRPDCHDWIPLMQSCVCYDRLGLREQALACHRAARALRPHDPAVQHNETYFAGQPAAPEP